MSKILETQALKKAFPGPSGKVAVLDCVDLAVNTGESLSIRGESGAGKTTLLYLLTALEQPDEGTVYWEGKNIFKKSPNWRAKRRGQLIGFVFQAYHLVPELNALENVILAHRIVNGRVNRHTTQHAKELLERVGLAERMNHLSNQLSGGECQRVAIARALINKPPLIMADEPTGNLDEATGIEVMELLLNLCDNDQTSLVLVTHNPAFAQRTQHQLFLSAGNIAENEH